MIDSIDKRELLKLKFKYGEYLIAENRAFYEIKEYVFNNFNIVDISNNREKIIEIDRYGEIRNFFYLSDINKTLKVERNLLNIEYFLIKAYGKEEIILALCHDLKLFYTSSNLLFIELILFYGITKRDIEENTYRLFTFLKVLSEEEEIERLKSIKPDFLTPKDKLNMLINKFKGDYL